MAESNRMADLLGPYYDAVSAAGLLGCSVADLLDLTSGGRLLGMTTSDGVPVYPAFQFTQDGTVRTGLLPVLEAFATSDPWTVAVWLRTPHEHLDEMTPDEWLAAGNEPNLVRVLAGHRAFDLSA